MTITEAICMVLQENEEGLTAKEIYNEIVKRELYTFGAKSPVNVVNSQIRRRCFDLDFPTASPLKQFKIVGYQGKKPKYCLSNQQDAQADETDGISRQGTDMAAGYLPEEKIAMAWKEHLSNIKQQVLESILKNSPDFFEHLVVELLLKMGYGSDKNSGIVTGRPHDGGIDGVISEDRLGLDLIYIQAKRYSSNCKIGRKDLQAFVGAMEHVQKGVFITTSSFTKEAEEFIRKQQQKSIKLIDGSLLSELLVKYEIGVLPAERITIYKLDYDYFTT